MTKRWMDNLIWESALHPPAVALMYFWMDQGEGTSAVLPLGWQPRSCLNTWGGLWTFGGLGLTAWPQVDVGVLGHGGLPGPAAVEEGTSPKGQPRRKPSESLIRSALEPLAPRPVQRPARGPGRVAGRAHRAVSAWPSPRRSVGRSRCLARLRLPPLLLPPFPSSASGARAAHPGI